MSRVAAPRWQVAPHVPSRRTAGTVLLVAAVVALGGYRIGGRGGLPDAETVLDVLRAAAASLVLFGAAGYAPARLLLPRSLQPHLPLFVLPVGAAVAALGLTVLGMLGSPLPASLALLLAAGIAGAVALRVRRGPAAASALASLAPGLLAVAVACVLVSPLMPDYSFATVLGQNGDAHLATGSAELLQHAPPGATRVELPIDRMPAVWGSKYPIYYALAGASELSGLDPVQAFATLAAVMSGLVAVGFFLFAFHALRAPAQAALLAAAFVALDRVVLRLALDPYYNQLWALFSLPFVLVVGLAYLRSPSRGGAALLLLFLALSVFAYPLLAPVPVLFLALAAWPERDRLRLPRGRRSLLLWIPAVILLLPFAAAAWDKLWGAFLALLPGGNLAPWHGSALPFHPMSHFLGLPDVLGFLVPAVLAFAVVGLRRAPREVAIPLATVMGALLVLATWVWLRRSGVLFHFKALGFFGPLAVCLAAVGLAHLAGGERTAARATGIAGIAVLAVAFVVNAREQLAEATPHVTRDVWQLRDWSERLPRGASVRVDVEPVGVQQWAWYMLADHPVSARHPLTSFFPYAPIGRRADYLLVNSKPRRPRDAAGAPLLRNRSFALYRMRAGVPGRDASSQRQIDPMRGAAGGE